tara:strand:+ start:1900 stop:2160 length:261 start_codon:yes stop_codon:yes gene_type:complete
MNQNQFIWNPKAKITPRWGVRIFHKEGRLCLRTKDIKKGKPPTNFYPCEHCFTMSEIRKINLTTKLARYATKHHERTNNKKNNKKR